MGLTLITPAAAWPVTLAEVKTYCAVEDGSFDGLLGDLIAVATGQIEEMTGLALAEQGWRLTLDQFSPAIELPKGPVIAVTSVKYIDSLGVQQTVDPGDYSLDLVSEPQWVVLNSDAIWPATLDAVNVVEISFTAGFAAPPPQLKLAIRMLVNFWFEQRSPGEIPAGVWNLVEPFRTLWISA